MNPLNSWCVVFALIAIFLFFFVSVLFDSLIRHFLRRSTSLQQKQRLIRCLSLFPYRSASLLLEGRWFGGLTFVERLLRDIPWNAETKELIVSLIDRFGFSPLPSVRALGRSQSLLHYLSTDFDVESIDRYYSALFSHYFSSVSTTPIDLIAHISVFAGTVPEREWTKERERRYIETIEYIATFVQREKDVRIMVRIVHIPSILNERHIMPLRYFLRRLKEDNSVEEMEHMLSHYVLYSTPRRGLLCLQTLMEFGGTLYRLKKAFSVTVQHYPTAYCIHYETVISSAYHSEELLNYITSHPQFPRLIEYHGCREYCRTFLRTRYHSIWSREVIKQQLNGMDFIRFTVPHPYEVIPKEEEAQQSPRSLLSSTLLNVLRRAKKGEDLVAILHEMVSLGADPHYQTEEDGITLLIAAAHSSRNFKVVRALIEEYNVDPYLSDNSGKTALEHSKRLLRREIERYLSDRVGARTKAVLCE